MRQVALPSAAPTRSRAEAYTCAGPPRGSRGAQRRHDHVPKSSSHASHVFIRHGSPRPPNRLWTCLLRAARALLAQRLSQRRQNAVFACHCGPCWASLQCAGMKRCAKTISITAPLADSGRQPSLLHIHAQARKGPRGGPARTRIIDTCQRYKRQTHARLARITYQL